MNEVLTKINSLPKSASKYLLAEIGINVNIDLGRKYAFSLKKMSDNTELINALYLKEVPVADLVNEVKKRLKLKVAESKAFALDLAIKRLLVADKYFDGEVSKLITSLGDDPSKYKDFISYYKKMTDAEIAQEKLDAEENKYHPPVEEPEIPEVPQPLEMGELDDEVKEMEQILGEDLVRLLKSSLYEMKIEFNIIMTTLMLEDEKYQKKLITALLQNQDLITKDNIAIKNEKVEPTISNWLKDYIAYVGMDDRINSINKAKYYNENQNIKSLSAEQRELMDKLFDLYDNLHNFYVDSARLPLTEIQLFSFTEAEQKDFLAKYGQGVAEETQDKGFDNEGDVFEMYMGEEDELSAVEKAEAEITEKTRNEYQKVVDNLYDVLIQRKRIQILASLNILTEIGGLDNLISTDKRFGDLLLGYFKRNNMLNEMEAFQGNPKDPKYVIFFLKYILMERLGMTENKAARIGMQIGNIFRQQGINQLAQLAYLDMETKQFKWLLTPEELEAELPKN